MKLSVKERVVLLSVLPAQGDLTTLKIIRKLREDLSFSEEEHKELKITQVGENGIRWEREISKDVEIGEKANDVIVNAFKDLDKKKQLHMDHVDIYEKFEKE